jgi:hypothetical protein
MNQNVEPQDIEASYRRMAADRAREQEALEWSEGLIANGQTKVGRTPSSARDPLVALLRLSSTLTLDGMLEKFAESPRCEAGILDNSAHRKRVHGVVPRDSQDSPAIGHDNVFPLPGNLEPRLFQSFDGAQMSDSRNLRHALRRNFHFPQIPLAGQIPRHFEVFADGVTNVRKGLLFGSALRPAPRKPRTGNAIPLFGWN